VSDDAGYPRELAGWVGRLAERARDMRDATLLAVLAAQARCVQVDLPAPALEDLEMLTCERQPDRWRVELRRAAAPSS
jgi:hypothetical protein